MTNRPRSAPARQSTKVELAARAKNYIGEHYTEKFSLDALASALFVNKIYLAKTFKEVTGSTLLRFFNETRCREACRLLAETDLNIEIIGNQVGYSTASHFAKQFRSSCGCTPSEYRKRNR